jgi:hypothetical protein
VASSVCLSKARVFYRHVPSIFDLLYRRTSQPLYDVDFVIVLYGESLALHRQRWWTPEEDGLDKPKTGSCVIELDKP